MAKPLLIGQLARGAGVKPDTVRFYERIRLLPPPRRTGSGYRTYDEASLRQLRFIRKAQALGFSLDEVRRILNLSNCGVRTCRSVIAIAEATLSETESRLRELEHFRDSLARNLRRWRKIPAQKNALSEFCQLIDSSSD